MIGLGYLVGTLAGRAQGGRAFACLGHPRFLQTSAFPFASRRITPFAMSATDTINAAAVEAAPTPDTSTATVSMPLGLFVFLIVYGGMTVLAGVVAFKEVQLVPSNLAVEAGIFPFLLLVVITSSVSQLYGKDMAQRLIWWGFIPLLLSAAIIFLVLNVPASPGMLAVRPEALPAFETVLGQTPRIMIAGPAAYITSLLLNIWIFDRLRGSDEGSTIGLMLRGSIASAISQALDSVIFITLAFADGTNTGGWFTNLMTGQVLAKVTLSFVLVPFLITFGVQFARWLDSRQTA